MIRQQKGTHSIAWFKLAEFIARGEKERALTIYKLLALSFQDRAVAHQLEGDLLFAFNDSQIACQKYLQAIRLYKEENRIPQAIALYEHMRKLQSNAAIFTEELAELHQRYQQDHWQAYTQTKKSHPELET